MYSWKAGKSELITCCGSQRGAATNMVRQAGTHRLVVVESSEQQLLGEEASLIVELA